MCYTHCLFPESMSSFTQVITIFERNQMFAFLLSIPVSYTPVHPEQFLDHLKDRHNICS